MKTFGVFNMFLEHLKKIKINLCYWIFLYSKGGETGEDQKTKFEKDC